MIHQLSELLLAMSGDGTPVAPALIVNAAASAVPHCRHAGLTLLRAERGPTTLAASDGLAEKVDALQYELGEGPCLDAATGPAVLLSDDLGLDDRWPNFGRQCVGTIGMRSMLSLRLPIGGADHAAISYYASDEAAFTEDDIIVASVLVPLAALSVEADLREADCRNLTNALQSSRQISIAVGILMTTQRLPEVEAFEALRVASMHLNTKLRVVAEEVTLTGELPSKHVGRP
ncbi:GAF and ANTAR domain-containing protein [Knoellia aerolata]|uniref:ANTAR domain-containing protein n=1 Tax=Knoellia aerolata DSM 18566 TaxID=1385519 RepID=A0A0A0JWG3_9MICO|nr:GAF and ANTAR domain-containing protein [Knoellia aerolata]KGN39951.1 hypothetical protein N801_17750 [Knoellia aerolata DSM 18566]